MPDRYLHPTERMEAAFRRDYPWRLCDEATRKAFYTWQGKRLNKLSKDPAFCNYEMGMRNILNAEKTEIEIEKAMLSWEIYNQELELEKKTQAQAERSVVEPDLAPPPLEAITQSEHLARLKGMWAIPRNRGLVEQRINDNPGWGIKLGPDGPEVSGDAGN
jgi:hypothetical protein